MKSRGRWEVFVLVNAASTVFTKDFTADVSKQTVVDQLYRPHGARKPDAQVNLVGSIKQWVTRVGPIIFEHLRRGVSRPQRGAAKLALP